MTQPLEPLEPLAGSNPLPSGVRTGEPVPRPNEASPAPVVPATVDESYDKRAGEFSGAESVGPPTLAFPNTEGGAPDAGAGMVGPAALKARDNMRRMYASDSTDSAAGAEVAGNTVIG